MRTSFRGSLAVGLLLLCVAPSLAAEVGFTYDGSLVSGAVRDDGPYTIGNQFSSTQTLTVDALGAQDISLTGALGQDAFGSNSVPVGLWTGNGATLLATATITAADPADSSGYRYASLHTPVVLSANTTYLIGALVGAVGSGSPGVPFGDSNYSTVNSSHPYNGSLPLGVTILQNSYNAGSSLTAPTSNGTQVLGRWAAANFQVTPEPSSFILCGLGGVGLLIAARRRRRA